MAGGMVHAHTHISGDQGRLHQDVLNAPEKWKMRESPGRASCTRRCICLVMLAFVGHASWLA